MTLLCLMAIMVEIAIDRKVLSPESRPEGRPTARIAG
jgi:hypothetical protein